MENDKREEAISNLYKWAKEDTIRRSLLVITFDEFDTRTIYTGSRGTLVEALTASMLKDEEVQEICVQALTEVGAFVSRED